MSTDDDLTRLAEVLDRTASWLRRTTRPAEWNSVAMSTLDALARTGPHRVSDLVAAEHITQPGMTGLLTRMETAGLLERAADPADGRATLVSVTSAGQAYLTDFHAQRAASVAAYLRTLSIADITALIGATDALNALADQTILEETK